MAQPIIINGLIEINSGRGIAYKNEIKTPKIHKIPKPKLFVLSSEGGKDKASFKRRKPKIRAGTAIKIK